MKIISCHIENFGKLSDQSFSFHDGVNVILEENGWGKSTLAAFLKIMLYGFTNDKKRDETENERKRFKPWQGGVYGGQLTFEKEGKSYIIYRTFGKKEAEDTFLVKDLATNLESREFTSKIGEELFHIDCDSFVRTVCITQNDCETFVTDSINAKIGNLVENTDDINNFDTVNNYLSSQINKLSPNRKTGLLNSLKEHITELYESTRKGTALDKSIGELIALKEEKHKQLEEIKNKRATLQKTAEALGQEKDIQAGREKYRDLCKVYTNRLEERDFIGKSFPGDLPTTEELSDMIETCEKVPVLRNLMETNTLSQNEAEDLNQLKENFSRKIPSDRELKEIEELVRDSSGKKVEMARKLMTDSETIRFMNYEERFVNGIPEAGQVDSLAMSWQQRTEKKNTLSLSKATLSTLQSMDEAARKQNSKKSNSISLALVLIGIVLVIFGIFSFSFNLAAGLVGFIIGIALAAFGLIIMLMRKPMVAQPVENHEILKLEVEIKDKEDFINHTEARVQDFCFRYGIEYDEMRMQDIFFKLKSDIKDYQELINKNQAVNACNLEKDYEEQCLIITKFLRDYLPNVKEIAEDSFENYIYTIRLNVTKYENLFQKSQAYLSAKREIEKITDMVKAYLQSLEMSMEEDYIKQLNRIKEGLLEYRKAEKEYYKAKQEKEIFETSTSNIELIKKMVQSNPVLSPLLDEHPENYSTLEEVNNEQNLLTAEYERLLASIREYDKQLDSLQEESDKISADEQELAELNDEYSSINLKYKRITQVQQYLRTAKENFTAKYMSPVMNSFEKYYKMLTRDDKNIYHVDANFDFKINAFGEEHELGLLSTGYRDLTGVCIRMALVEAMYEVEAPFLLFDDPFVNLDKSKIHGGVDFMRSIGEKYQIIYFTCHESREMI